MRKPSSTKPEVNQRWEDLQRNDIVTIQKVDNYGVRYTRDGTGRVMTSNTDSFVRRFAYLAPVESLGFDDDFLNF